MSGILVFDIETKCVMNTNSARRVNKGGVIPTVYDESVSALGILQIGYAFGKTLKELAKAPIILCGVEDMRGIWNKCDHIVGFNLQFDYNLMNVHGMSELGKKATDLYTLIIHKIFGYSYDKFKVGGRKMGQVAEANGMDGKGGDILKLLFAMYSGDENAMNDINYYLEQDVRITVDLFRKVVTEKKLIDPKTKENVYF